MNRASYYATSFCKGHTPEPVLPPEMAQRRITAPSFSTTYTPVFCATTQTRDCTRRRSHKAQGPLLTTVIHQMSRTVVLRIVAPKCKTLVSAMNTQCRACSSAWVDPEITNRTGHCTICDFRITVPSRVYCTVVL